MPLSKTSDPRDHYVELDALRGIAILTVVLSHVVGGWVRQTKIPVTVPLLGVDAANLLSFMAAHGVSLFFLLSGYLLAWTEGKRARHGTYSVGSYALRRIFRLAPAYYVTILVSVVVLQPRDLSGADVLMHASFLHSLNPYTIRTINPVWWSLTPEVIFYCLLPFIILKLPRLSQRLALFGAFALVSLTTRIYYASSLGDDANWLTLWVINPLFISSMVYMCLAGVLLRMLVEHLHDRPASWLQPRLATALFLTSVVGMIAVSPIAAAQLRLTDEGSNTWRLLEMATQPLLIFFFASALLGSPLLRAALKWRLLAFVGMISYSLFLLHYTMLEIVSQRVLASIGKWVVHQSSLVVWTTFVGYVLAILIGASAIAYLSYRFIESPAIRLGRVLPAAVANLPLPKALRGSMRDRW